MKCIINRNILFFLRSKSFFISFFLVFSIFPKVVYALAPPSSIIPKKPSIVLTQTERDIIINKVVKREDGSPKIFAFANLKSEEDLAVTLRHPKFKEYFEDVDTLIMPAAGGNLAFILNRHNPKSITIADMDPVTIAWQKAFILYSGHPEITLYLDKTSYWHRDKRYLVNKLSELVAKDEPFRIAYPKLSVMNANAIEPENIADNSFDTIVVPWIYGVSGGD